MPHRLTTRVRTAPLGAARTPSACRHPYIGGGGAATSETSSRCVAWAALRNTFQTFASLLYVVTQNKLFTLRPARTRARTAILTLLSERSEMSDYFCRRVLFSVLSRGTLHLLCGTRVIPSAASVVLT